MAVHELLLPRADEAPWPRVGDHPAARRVNSTRNDAIMPADGAGRRRHTVSDTDFDAVDCFRAGRLYQNPYPYYEYLREHGPVWREPHHGVVMVTGYHEATLVYHDTDRYSNCVAV